MSKNHEVGHKFAQDGGALCRRWSEWCFILELCQPKRDWNTHKTRQFCLQSWRHCWCNCVWGWQTAAQQLEGVIPAPPPCTSAVHCQCYCLCLWSHTVSGVWDVIWANNKPLRLLPSQMEKQLILALFRSQNSCMNSWSCLHKCEAVAGQGVLEQGAQECFQLLSCWEHECSDTFSLLFCSPLQKHNSAERSLHRCGRKRCTTKQIDKNSPKIICFQSGSESCVVLNMLWFLRWPCILQELSCKQLAFN